MSTLKQQLFPDSNITGFTDRNNQPILVGQSIRDERGIIVKVHEIENNYFVRQINKEGVGVGYVAYLSMWLTQCDYVEIVVQKPEQNEAPVAIAPFRDIKNAAKKVKKRAEDMFNDQGENLERSVATDPQ